jgi:HEAT repeat protein
MSNPEDERLKQWLRVLQEPNAEMSKIAADKLGDLRRSEAVPVLIEQMRKRTAFVAAACAGALGKIGDKKALSTLAETMKSHSDVVVQTACAEALGELRTSEAVPHLKAVVEDYLNTFKHDRFNLTRGMKRGLFTTAIHALRMIGTPQALRIADNAEKADRA